MPFTYILYSQKLDKYYVGSCIDLERRLYEHNIRHSKFTSLGIPWKLEYAEQYETAKLAKARELQIKRMKSRKYIQELIAKGRASLTLTAKRDVIRDLMFQAVQSISSPIIKLLSDANVLSIN